MESYRFKNIIKNLKPDIKVLWEIQLKLKYLFNMKFKKKEFKIELKNNSSLLSFTSDVWNAPNNISYMAITVHFINNNWERISKILDFIPFHNNFFFNFLIIVVLKNLADISLIIKLLNQYKQ